MYLSIYSTFILTFVAKLTLCNDSPVIGILTQEMYWWSNLQRFAPLKQSYIAASYVKSIESSGGRVIPVYTNRSTEYYLYVST